MTDGGQERPGRYGKGEAAVADRILGIDFGSSGIKLAELLTNKDGVTVTRQGFMPLEQGLVVNGLPDQHQVSAIASDLKAFLARAKFTAKEAVMGINSVDDVFANRAIAPWHEPKDFHTAIKFDVMADKSLIQGSPEGAIIDAVIFNDFKEEDGTRKLDAFLVAITSTVIDTQMEILQKAGLNVAGSDLTALGLLRATRLSSRPEGDLDVIVDIGQDVLSVLIHDNGKPYSVSLTKAAAGKEASKLIAENLMDDDLDRADREKVSLSADHRVLSALNEYRHTVTMAIEEAITSYITLRKVKVRIAGITLAGGGSLVRGLPETLQAHFRMPVVPALYETNIAGDYSEFHTGKVTNADFRAAVGLGMGALV